MKFSDFQSYAKEVVRLCNKMKQPNDVIKTQLGFVIVARKMVV